MTYPSLIEMRYLIVDGEKVLQYRYRMPKYTDSVIRYPGDWVWQEWKSVPEVNNETMTNIEK